MQEGVASERFLPYKFVLEREGVMHKQFSQKYARGTIAKYLEKHDLIDECIEWLEKNHPGSCFGGPNSKTFVHSLQHIKTK